MKTKQDRRLRARRLSPLWLLGVLLFLLACSSIDCPVENVVSVQYEIYAADGTELKLSDTLTVTSQRRNGTDTTLLNQLVGQSAFSLPVSYSHPEDVLLFSFARTDSTQACDTVWIKKEDIPHFESVDCNAAFFHELTSVRHTGNAIDSLVLINRTVNYDTSTIHFRLYPKTGD